MLKIIDDLTLGQLFDGAKFIKRYEELDHINRIQVRNCFENIQNPAIIDPDRQHCINHLIKIFQPIFRYKSEVKIVTKEQADEIDRLIDEEVEWSLRNEVRDKDVSNSLLNVEQLGY